MFLGNGVGGEGIEDAAFAEPTVKFLHFGDGLFAFAQAVCQSWIDGAWTKCSVLSSQFSVRIGRSVRSEH